MLLYVLTTVLLLSSHLTDHLAHSFNLDQHSPIYKFGPKDSFFGYSVAQHLRRNEPVILVGAPKAESGQRGTSKAGALFSCSVNTYFNSGRPQWCSQIRSEYPNSALYEQTPDHTHVAGKPVHYLGKNNQLFGASLASQAAANGSAVVCAPLMRFHNSSAFAEGVCYELDTDLTLKTAYSTCLQKNLPRNDRHNEYGACMEGFSAAYSNNTLVSGVIGAMKWTGGVFAQRTEGGLFGTSQTKYTMAQEEGGIRTRLTAHDYLGYSVDVGRFGFWHEDGKKRTIVSGATRSGQHGAVIFLPFNTERGDQLTFTSDKFVLNGTKMGSAFGYALEVVDLDNDGFDDLVVGAPFEHRIDTDGHFGGVVYVYFSKGQQRQKDESNQVFHEPLILKGPPFFSQFGLSITTLGNLNGDRNGYRDIAIGAPYENDGVGTVYVFLGAPRDQFLLKPAQVIRGSELPSISSLRAFGFSLSGGVDLDSNEYPDLVVGAVSSDVVAVFRSRPVISISSTHKHKKFIDIDRRNDCPHGARVCFPLELSIVVDAKNGNSKGLVDFNTDVLVCNLEVIASKKGGAIRALIEDNSSFNYSWPCGRGVHSAEGRTYTRKIYFPVEDDSEQDWITPMKFRFTVRIKNERVPTFASEGQPLVNLNDYPILDKFGSTSEFEVPFNTRCGDDHVCQTDLSLKATFAEIAKTDEGFVANVGEKDYIDVSFTVENKGEKAYQTSLFLTYDQEELELPELREGKKLSLETHGKNLTEIHLGNPMNGNTKHAFIVRFKLVRGRSEGIGRPLMFKAFVNSTSQEMNPADNSWEEQLRVIKKAELVLQGTSDPHMVRFGGDVKGESEMELEEDIGVMVRHNYTLTNLGPWTVRNVVAKFQWPHQVKSRRSRGKWALYLLDVPTVTLEHTDGTVEIRRCSVERSPGAAGFVNPRDIRLNTKYSTQVNVGDGPRFKRNTQFVANEDEDADSMDEDFEDEEDDDSDQSPSRPQPQQGGFFSDRVDSHKREENGATVEVVKISCADKTAKCFTVTCHFDFIDANSVPVIDFRARLWNSTFVEDYSRVEYVEIESSGVIELDPTQGIQDDESNNVAFAYTRAYPDQPSIGESRPWPWWLIPLAILIGLLILLILVFVLYKCGFFRRKRVNQPSLYRAQLQYEREEWAQSAM